jgi:lipoprotein-releasing system permease protein
MPAAASADFAFPMIYELFIGLRYVRARKRDAERGRRNGFLSFIAGASMLGLALGVAALIVVLSVMNGFQKEVRARILGVASHVQIGGLQGELTDWQQLASRATANPHVLAAAPYVQNQAMLSFDQEVRGAVIRGVLPADEERVADFSQYLRAGRLDALRPGEFGIILGAELAYGLRVTMGDKVTLIAPQGLVTPAAVLPRVKQFRVVGIFDSGMLEYDAGLALVHMRDAQVLYRMGENVSGVRLKLDDLFLAQQVSLDLVRSLDADVSVTDWTRAHSSFFRALEIEKRMMFIILTLIVAVAAFNIVSTLVMTVRDKQADIAILRTLGASPGSVMSIFVVQGALIGVIGLALGVLGGALLAWNIDVVVATIERLFNVRFLSKDVYPIAELPSDLQWPDVWSVALLSFLLTLVATLYPSWRAARVNPAEALRYE